MRLWQALRQTDSQPVAFPFLDSGWSLYLLHPPTSLTRFLLYGVSRHLPRQCYGIEACVPAACRIAKRHLLESARLPITIHLFHNMIYLTPSRPYDTLQLVDTHHCTSTTSTLTRITCPISLHLLHTGPFGVTRESGAWVCYTKIG